LVKVKAPHFAPPKGVQQVPTYNEFLKSMERKSF
jgi:hypothetical protein